MNGRTITIVLAVIVVVLGGWLLFGGGEGSSPGQPSPHAIDQTN